MVSAFKTLFTDIVNVGGDPAKQNKDLKKQMLKVFVKETTPYFLISDSYFYVPAYFTQAALDEFSRRFPSVKILDLAERVILISKWSLELKRVDSNAVFTSYQGLEVRLIVHSFKPQLGESLHPTVWPTNLYRDDEFKTSIKYFRYRCIQESCEKIQYTEVPLHSKGPVSQGIVKGEEPWTFTEGTTKVVLLAQPKPVEKKVEATAAGTVKVKGGLKKRKIKAAAKKVKKEEASGVGKTVDKVLKFTPGKGAKGKKSITNKEKGGTPAGKKSQTGTTDAMTMQTLKKFLQF